MSAALRTCSKVRAIATHLQTRVVINTTILLAEVVPVFQEKDEGKKAELKEKVGKESLPAFASNFEKVLKANGGKWLVGGDLTWADIAVAVTLDGLGNFFSNEWKESSPDMVAFIDRVFSQPNIKKWIDTRPKTEM